MKLITTHHQTALSIPLNLLSQEDKKRIKSNIALYVMRDVFLLFLFTILIVAVLLLISNIALDNNYREIVAATKLAESQQPLFQQRVNEVSSKSEQLFRIQKTWRPIAPYIWAVSEAIQSPATLSSLVVDRKTNTVSITGDADARSDVLEIQKRLESLSFSSSVDSPLSNILQPRDINFEFTVHLRNEEP